MGKKTTRVTRRSTALVNTDGDIAGHSRGVSQTVETTEFFTERRLNASVSNSSVYVYEEDPWERSPKTDYTYSRTATYSKVHLNDDYVHPNMSRRRLRSEYVDQSCGDLLSSSSSSTTMVFDLGTRFRSEEKSKEYAGESGLRKEKEFRHLYGLDEPDGSSLVKRPLPELRDNHAVHSRRWVTLLTYIITVLVTIVSKLWICVKYPAVVPLSMISRVFSSSSSSSRTVSGMLDHHVVPQRKWLTLLTHVVTTSVTTANTLWTVVKYPVVVPISIISHCFITTLTTLRTLKYSVISSMSSIFHSTNSVTLLNTLWSLVKYPYVGSVSAISNIYRSLHKARRLVSTNAGNSVVHASRSVDTYILSSTSRLRSCIGCWLLPLLLILPLLIIGLFYMLSCGSTGFYTMPSLFPVLITSSSEEPASLSPVIPVDVQKAGSAEDALFKEDTLIVGGIPAGSSAACGCTSEGSGGLVAGFASRDELEQWLNDRISLTFSDQMRNVKTDLDALRVNIEGWTTGHVAAEIEAHGRIASDRSNKRFNDLSIDHNDISERLNRLTTQLNELKGSYNQLASSSVSNAEYNDLAARVGETQARYDQLASDLRIYSNNLELVQKEAMSAGKTEQVDDSHLNILADDVKKLQIAVRQLQTDYITLSQQSASCCRNEGQLTEQVRAIVLSYFSKLTVGTDETAETLTEDEKRSKLAFAAWLDSRFTNQKDLDIIRDDLNAKVEAASRAANVAVENSLRLAEESTKSESKNQDDEDSANAAGLGIQGTAIELPSCSSCSKLTSDDVKAIILTMLKDYDANKTGRADFALESAGGSVISTRCTQTYQARTALLSLFNIPLWYTSNSPRVAIQPGVQPGECWPFVGSEGYLVIQLSTEIVIDEVSIEHIPASLSPTGKIDSAPKDFSIWGLRNASDSEGIHLGNFTYVQSSDPLQRFRINYSPNNQPPAFQFVELRIHSNHGHQKFTCLYRFRVHGQVQVLRPS